LFTFGSEALLTLSFGLWPEVKGDWRGAAHSGAALHDAAMPGRGLKEAAKTVFRPSRH
jgi:hypothetical protein